jgi:choline dehydrogenase-like flavoprotein
LSLSAPRSESYDYVVVGAGSSGCAAAARLAELSDARVALIEAGPPAAGRLFEVPALFSQQLKSAFDWDYQSEPEPGLGGRRAYLPRGRAMGGTSSMNTMLYVRGHRSDYDRWRDLGNPGWGYEEVLPFFKRSEDNERGADRYHGVGGPLAVSDPPSVHPLLDAWIEAGVQAGHPHNEDFNGATQEGVGRYQLTQRDGLRCSSAVAFLDPPPDNLTVLHSTLALGIVWDGERAASLRVDHAEEIREIGIDGELIVSAGAYNSPHLLLQSGVGDPAELEAAGVVPVHDLAGVGRNLQDHAGCFLSFLSDVPPMLGPDTSAAEAQLRRDGEGPMAWCEVGGFLHSSEEVEAPDIQLHAALGIVRDEGLAAPLDHGFSFGPYVARPTSRGTVRVRHPHPYAKPRISHCFLSDEDERRRLRAGIRMAMEIARQPAITRHLETDLESSAELGLAPHSDTDAAIDEYVAKAGFSFYHPCGTCAMGDVVDHELRVNGLENVRVADTSIMPTLVTGNTNAPAIMIGERVAALIKGT